MSNASSFVMMESQDSKNLKRLDSVGHVIPEVAEAREVRGWYAYDWSNGAYFYSAMNFIPLMITSQLRELAKEQYCDTMFGGACQNNEWAADFEKEGICSDLSLDTAAACNAADGDWEANLRKNATNVDFFGMPMGYASFTQYCLTVSVLIQLFVFVTMGSFADYGSNRKSMFIAANSIGITSCGLIFFNADKSLYWLSGVFFIIAIVCFSFAVVFYNAYLPLLASATPTMVKAKEDGANKDELLALNKSTTHEMSIRGLAAGFSGQLLFLIMNLVLLKTVTSKNYLNTRLSILAAAVWVFVFSSYTFWVIKARPGPALPAGESYVKHSVQSAWRTLKSFGKLTELGKFLVAYFIFSDGTSTLAQAAPVFAQEELSMTMFEIAIGLVLVSICAVLGCFFFMHLHDHRGYSSKTLLTTNLVLMGLIPIYGQLFMREKWEFYLGVMVFGLNTGSQQAFTRSIYASFIPFGREAEYFSFYEISDKGTAWLGPLAVGLVFQSTGSYRTAFFALIFFFVLGVFALSFFDPKRAEQQKKDFDDKDTAKLFITKN